MNIYILILIIITAALAPAYAQDNKVTLEAKLDSDSKIIQNVMLDEKDPPKGIMIKLYFEGGDDIAVYWEGEEEVFIDSDDYMKAWYMGVLPKPGEWAKLEIDCREFDLNEVKLTGLSFIAKGGKASFGEAVVEKKEKENAEEKTQRQAELAEQEGQQTLLPEQGITNGNVNR